MTGWVAGPSISLRANGRGDPGREIPACAGMTRWVAGPSISLRTNGRGTQGARFPPARE